MKLYRLSMANVDGSYYEFIVDDIDHVKSLLKTHDHEGCSWDIHEMANITEDFKE